MKFGLVFTLSLLILHAAGQTILYSKPETKDFDRFRFHIITRKDNRILIYKSMYFNSLADPNRPVNIPMRSTPSNSIMESAICIYDSTMEQLSENILPLPKAISGVSFLVYDDFFYLFYQYLRGHTVYCMAVPIDMKGVLRHDPIALDSTENIDFYYQSQIYSVINSEDRDKIMVFTLGGIPASHTTAISAKLFDKNLHLLHKTIHEVSMAGSEYLSEFHLDNKGNFLFLGLSHTVSRNKAETVLLFTLPPAEDSLSYDYVLSGYVFVDDIHLLVDNSRGRYILSSFYTEQPAGNVRGLFTQIRDAARIIRPKTTFTVLSDTLRLEMRDGETLREVFNTWYIQDLRLLQDGSFTLETQQLERARDYGPIDRWNNHNYKSDQVASNFFFYDFWDKDRNWPWSEWRRFDALGYRLPNLRYSSVATLVARFDTSGIVQWLSRFNMPQHDYRHNRIGYASLIADGRLYFIYNENIRHKRFLSGQCIDASGELNTDIRFREDGELQGQKEDYTYYPRLGEQVGAGELIMPCQKGRQVCLAMLRL